MKRIVLFILYLSICSCTSIPKLDGVNITEVEWAAIEAEIEQYDPTCPLNATLIVGCKIEGAEIDSQLKCVRVYEDGQSPDEPQSLFHEIHLSNNKVDWYSKRYIKGDTIFELVSGCPR